MASFDSTEDLTIIKAWYCRLLPRKGRIRNLWAKIYNKYRQDYGNPKRRSLQEIHDRHQITQDAIVSFIAIQQQILNASHFSSSLQQFKEVVKARYLEEKREAFTFDDESYHFIVSKIPEYARSL
ncbi:hypothetical protein C5167_041907 [Papaver somniferum]|nr:hypothetical protein C5167_041907 [Papaver somniferum]